MFQKKRSSKSPAWSVMPLVSKVLILPALVVVVSGCAGALLNKVGGEKDLPKELPKELQEQFAVKEQTEATLASAPEKPDAAQQAKSLKKPMKGKKVKTPVAAVPKPGVTPAPSSGVLPVSAKVESKAGQPLPLASPELAKGEFLFPVRRPEKSAIWIGEKQVYEVSYFGVAAGDFTVTVEPYKWVGNRKAYHVRGTAISSKVFSLFYRMNDEVETYIDYDGIFSHRFHILLNESKQSRDALELNDSIKGQTFYWNRWQKKDQPFIDTKEYFPIQPFSQDSLSALYYLRSVPLPDGAVVTFPVINEGKTWEAQVSVVRREVIDSPMGKVRTVVLRPDAKYQGILKKQGDNLIWLTDDDRRFMVKLEAKVKIGTVVAKLKSVELGKQPESKPSPSPLATSGSGSSVLMR